MIILSPLLTSWPLPSNASVHLRINAFLLSMAGTVLQKILCGPFKEGTTRQLVLDDVHSDEFTALLDLWSGKVERVEMQAGELLRLVSVADRLGMTEVGVALEDVFVSQLSADTCVEALVGASRLGLGRVEAAAYAVAVDRFPEISDSGTSFFTELDEEVIAKLLDEESLGIGNEEAVYEGLVRWMKRGDGGWRGRGLLEKVRFGAMSAGYLAGRVLDVLDGECLDWARALVEEAVRGKAATTAEKGAPDEAGLHGAKETVWPRRGRGVAWERFQKGDNDGPGGRILGSHSCSVAALAECAGRVCSGANDGSIRVWNSATLEEEQALKPEDGVEQKGVHSLVEWEGLLVSGHRDGAIKVWDVGAGTCLERFAGHPEAVTCLCVCESRVVSGSWDRSIKVWGPGADGALLACERTIKGHGYCVTSLAAWGGCAVSGSWDRSVRVWDAATGSKRAVLTGHKDIVTCVLVHEDRTFSGSEDRTVRVWGMGTWELMATVRVGGGIGKVWSLAVSGSKLVGGAKGNVVVWDLDSLEWEHTIEQTDSAVVRFLGRKAGEVWAGVGPEVVVWGRD
jgi:hypothetical protein